MWHRKARKTYTAITELVKQAHARIGVYWHIFPTYGEAYDAVWLDPNMLFNIIDQRLIDHVNITNLTVFLKCGSILQLKGADKPDALRGPNPYGVVFDEFATLKKEAWQVIEPILRANGGWCWFIGTPKGKNHLYDFYHLGQEGHKEWKSWLLKASQSGIISSDQLAESRRTSTQAMWNQEWECEFLEGEGTVFRGVEAVMISKPEKPIPGRTYVMGVDLAKVQDYTVIRIFDTATNSLVFSDRFQTLEWPFQKRRIVAYAQHYNHAIVPLDATGIGDPIADDLIRSGVSVVPFKITEQTKKDIIEKLSIWIEQKKIKLLPQEEAKLEYENFTYEIGPTGKIRYGARTGFHDDIPLADALAVWHLNPVYMPEFTPELTPTQVHFQRMKAKYEKESEEPDNFGEGGDYEEWSESPSGGW